MRPRRSLGKDFAPPDRSAGLRTMLPPPTPPSPTSTTTLDDEPAPEAAAASRNDRRRPDKARPRVERRPESGGLALVVVYLSDSVYQALRDRARSWSRSYTDIALDAVETHLEALRTHWKDDAVPTSATGALFARRQPNRVYREEPTRQVQLRLQTDAAATLRRVATECEAPSTTALVDHALRRDLLDHGHGKGNSR